MPKFSANSAQEITAEMTKQTKLAATFAKGYLAKLVANPPQTEQQAIDCFNSAMVTYAGEADHGSVKHPLFEDLHNHLQNVFSNENKAKEIMWKVFDKGLADGVAEYQKRNGGEMPHDTVFAAAFSDAQNVLDHYNSIGVLQSPSLALVPEIVAASMYTRLASSIPIAMPLPNVNGSGEVPLLVGRMVASKDFGAMQKGDPMDGGRGGLPFMNAKREYAMSNGGAGLVYTITPRVSYDDIEALTPDAATAAAPFKGGRVAILVNGFKVAHDAFKGHKINTGTSLLTPVQEVVLEGTAIVVSSATANLDTHAISVTFGAALPVGAVVTAEIILDYERKDNNGNYLIKPPSLDITTEEETIRSVPSYATMTVGKASLEVLRRQTGFEPLSAGIAFMQANYYLEQNLTVLRQAKRKTKAMGTVIEFDASRGVVGGQAAAYNTTAQLFGEVIRKKNEAVQKINKRTGGIAMSVDIFCTERVATLFDTLTGAYGYKRIAAAVGVDNAIVRIGQFDDGTNVYVLPKNEAPVLTDSNDLKASELLIIGRVSDPVKSPIVSTTAVPPTTREFDPEFFEQGVGIFVDSDVVINPLARYGEAMALIEMTNLPL